jgi:DNA-binding NarL/FixJ family response regulator
MPTLRAAFVSMPPVIADIMRNALKARVPLIKLVELSDRSALAGWRTRHPPDIICVGLAASEGMALPRALLERFPAARVIAFSDDGRIAHLLMMEARCATLTDPGLDEIVEFAVGPRRDRTH